MKLLQKLLFRRIDPEKYAHRKDVLLNQFDFLLTTLENNKFDILYMERLKQPLTPDERIYFMQQLDRIESAKNVIVWMKNNVLNNENFWRKLLRW